MTTSHLVLATPAAPSGARGGEEGGGARDGKGGVARPAAAHQRAKVRALRLTAAALACASLAMVSTACGSGHSHATTTTTHKYGY